MSQKFSRQHDTALMPAYGLSGKNTRVAALGIVLAAAVLACVFYFFISAGSASRDEIILVITASRKEVLRKPLSEVQPGVIPVEGPLGTTLVLVEGDRVKVSESPCENHICVNTGWISRPNEIIVCLPNEVVVRLERGNSR